MLGARGAGSRCIVWGMNRVAVGFGLVTTVLLGAILVVLLVISRQLESPSEAPGRVVCPSFGFCREE